MFRPRVIPVLLLTGTTLVKSRNFEDYRYIGDPINAVRIFNELEADELVFLDILATREKRSPFLELIKDIGEQANMPFAVGGGIRSIQDIRNVTAAGAEKVVIRSAAVENPDFILNASSTFGASTIVVCMDVKRDHNGEDRVWNGEGSETAPRSPLEFARLMEEKGAGEIMLQSVDRDGTMGGYDIDLVRRVSEAVSIPVICLGGAGNLEHMKQAHIEGHASALAGGSMFVFHDQKRGVLINYPRRAEMPF